MRVIKSIVAGLFLAFFIIVSTSFIISFVYEDEVSAFFLKELNKRVKADIRAEAVNLSLLRRFPNATVELRHFQLLASSDRSEANGEGNLSFTAEHVFFQFDVIDIFTRNYKFNKVYVNHSQLTYTPNGEKSLVGYRERKSANVHFDIEKMVFNDLYYALLNSRQNFYLEGHSSRTALSGNFGLDEFDLSIDSKLFVKNLSIDHFTYAREKDVRLRMDLLVTPEEYRVNSGTCYFESIPFSTDGRYDRDQQTIDVGLRGNSLDVNDFQLYLPWKLKKKVNTVYIEDGQLDFYARIEGPLGDGKPNLEADFSLREGQARLQYEQDYRLKHIALDGYLSNGRHRNPGTSLLSLSNLYAELGKNRLDCNVKISDFTDPQLVSEGHIKLDLNDLSGHLKSEALNHTAGLLDLNYKYSDMLKDISGLPESIRFGNLTLDAAFTDLETDLGGMSFQNMNGFAYLNRDLHLDSVNLTFNGNDMVVDGKIIDIYRNLADSTQPYLFELAAYSPWVDIKRLLSSPRSSPDTAVNFHFPDKMRGHLAFAVRKMKIREFTADRVRGKLAFDRKRLKLTDAEFGAFGGTAYAQAELKGQPEAGEDLFFDSKFYLDRVSIHQVFESFDNFGQQYITDKNLGGYLSGEVTFSTDMDHHLNVRKKTVSNVSDIQITNGELIDFEPLLSMSNFVHIDELRHVTFSKLSNQITIEDQTVRIPEMSINSSSYDIQVSGYHTFNNQFSYDVSLLLSQVLSRKARQRDQFESEFGNIQEDGVGRSRLYLKIQGTPDKYAIEYDKEGVKEKIREDLAKEKQELKRILNEEFGWFKRDTAVVSSGKQEPAGQFDIRWEEDSTGKKGNQPAKKKKDPQFIIKFEEDTIK